MEDVLTKLLLKHFWRGKRHFSTKKKKKEARDKVAPQILTVYLNKWCSLASNS